MATNSRKRQVSGRNRISELPEEIIAKIFWNLPFLTLLACRRVCKLWRGILHSSDLRSASTFTLVHNEKAHKLYLIEDIKVGVLADLSLAADRSFRLINSCRGLLCATLHRSSRTLHQDHRNGESIIDRRIIHIINPVTGEYVTLPPCPEDMVMEGSGLGFCLEAEQYKVLRVTKRMVRRPVQTGMIGHFYEKSGDHVFEIYTLGATGGGAWRMVEMAETWYFDAFYDPWNNLTYANGSLYWVGRARIYAFNLGSENVSQVLAFDYKDKILGLGPLRDDAAFLCCSRGELPWQNSAAEILTLVIRRRRDLQVVNCLENGDTVYIRCGELCWDRLGEGRLRYFAGIGPVTGAIVYFPSSVSLKDILPGESSKMALAYTAAVTEKDGLDSSSCHPLPDDPKRGQTFKELMTRRLLHIPPSYIYDPLFTWVQLAKQVRKSLAKLSSQLEVAQSNNAAFCAEVDELKRQNEGANGKPKAVEIQRKMVSLVARIQAQARSASATFGAVLSHSHWQGEQASESASEASADIPDLHGA